MKKGVSLVEVSISLLIIVTSLIVFLSLSSNYLITVRNSIDLYTMGVLAQEGLELAYGWRNKSVEVDFGDLINPPQINGNFCINFSNNNINLSLSQNPCPINFIGQSPPITYYRILNFRTDSNKLIYVTSSVNSSLRNLNNVSLRIILTPWHVIFR